MSSTTNIEWTSTVNPDGTVTKGSTWNPVTGCTKVSPGCAHCYAETLYERFHGRGSFGTVTLHPERLALPLRWRKPRRVFVNSMSDLFHEDVPFEFVDRVFAVMALTPQHTYQVLTKRPERMRAYLIGNSGHSEARLQEVINVQGKGEVSLQLNRAVQQRARRQSPGEAERSDRRPERFRGGQGVLEVHPFGNSGNDDRQPSGIGDVRDREDVLPRLHGGREVVDRVEERMEHICGERGWCAPSPLLTWPLPNVWLGTSVENQHWADIRIPELLATPAAVRFVSYEPALSAVDFRSWLHDSHCWDLTVADEAEGGFRYADGDDGPCICGEPREDHIDWIIVGGESGPKARPFDIGWARSVVEQCEQAAAACFVKQLGAKPTEERHQLRAPGLGAPVGLIAASVPVHVPMRLKSRKGGDMAEWPKDLRVREMPRD